MYSSPREENVGYHRGTSPSAPVKRKRTIPDTVTSPSKKLQLSAIPVHDNRHTIHSLSILESGSFPGNMNLLRTKPGRLKAPIRFDTISEDRSVGERQRLLCAIGHTRAVNLAEPNSIEHAQHISVQSKKKVVSHDDASKTVADSVGVQGSTRQSLGKNSSNADTWSRSSRIGAGQVPRWPSQFTEDQSEKMTPAEQEKFKQEHKEYESLRKVAQLSQGVNAMKKLPLITNMDPQSRRRIINMLTSDTLKEILTRFDTFLIAFAQTGSNLQMLQNLILHRWRLTQQFKPKSVADKTFIPADLFSLHAQNLEAIINQITDKFQQNSTKDTTSA